jgi:hypothetical protein
MYAILMLMLMMRSVPWKMRLSISQNVFMGINRLFYGLTDRLEDDVDACVARDEPPVVDRDGSGPVSDRFVVR